MASKVKSAAERIDDELKEYVLAPYWCVIKRVQETYYIEKMTDLDLLGEMPGPRNTPYYEGKPIFVMHFTEEYPVVPPTIVFSTYIWHPNVDVRTGQVRCSRLDRKWNSTMTIGCTLEMLFHLFSEPDREKWFDNEVTRQYLNKPQMFQATAKLWTKAFSKDRIIPDQLSLYQNLNLEFRTFITCIKQLANEMREPKSFAEACAILSINDWDLEKALVLGKELGRDPFFVDTSNRPR